MDVAVAHRLLLVRHSEIASHRGDVPLTDNGVEIARQVGRELGKDPGEPPWVGGLEYAVLPDRSLRVSAFAIDRT